MGKDLRTCTRVRQLFVTRRGTHGSRRLASSNCDRFRTLAKKIIGMSKQEQENAIPTFTRKVMKDQRTLIRFSLRIPFEDETIICEGLQSVGVQFLRSREPAGYMESQLSRFLNVMEGRA